VRTSRLDSFTERQSLDPHIACSQQFVRPAFDPVGHRRIGGAAVGRVVLEASVLGGVVRWRDDNAVSKMLPATAVVNENGSRDNRGWRYAVTLLDDCLHVVRRQDLECGALCGRGQRVSVFSHIEWTVSALLPPVVADRLSNCQNVRLGKCAVQRRTAVSAGAEADELVGIMEVGMARKIVPLEASDVQQHLLRSRFARERRNRAFVGSRCH
jgi:hypothetical protein